MTKLRLWIALLLTWLLLFFNIERFHEPLNIASFVYVLAALIAILIVVLRSDQGLRFASLVGASLVSLIMLKWALGYRIIGPGLPITVTEVSALLITAGFGWLIAQGIREFEANAHQVLNMHFDSHTPSLDTSQAQLYREVRRSRKFGRPLTLLALSASNAETPGLVTRYLEEIQQRGIRKYIDARLAQLLSDSISDSDILAYGNNRFFVLCPELTHDKAQDVIGRLASSAQDQLGLDLQIGSASFPNEEVTLGGLLAKAEAVLNGERGPSIATPQAFASFDDALHSAGTNQAS
jgi:hypothetical protein